MALLSISEYHINLQSCIMMFLSKNLQLSLCILAGILNVWSSLLTRADATIFAC